jgi:hypothetical protein
MIREFAASLLVLLMMVALLYGFVLWGAVAGLS